MTPDNPDWMNEGNGADVAPQRQGVKASFAQRVADLNRAEPCSEEHEMALLCGLLADPDKRLELCRQRVPVEAVYHPIHRVVYEVLLALADAGLPWDMPTVTNALRERGQLDKVGGPGEVSAYFAPLHWAMDTEWNFAMRVLIDKHLLRRLLAGCVEIMEACYACGSESDHGRDVAAVIELAESHVFEVGESLRNSQSGTFKREFIPQRQVLYNVVDQVHAILDPQNRGQIMACHVPTGFTDFDRMTGGLKAGQHIVLAARPAMGKTSLAMNVANNAALASMHYQDGTKYLQPKKIAVITLEMSAEEIVTRELVGGAGIDMTTLRSGIGMRNDQQADLARRTQELMRADIMWLDTPGIAIQEVASKLRRLKANHGLDLVVIDYMQLLKSNSRRARQSREIEIAEISSGLKALAKELQVPVISLAQLNRKAEERKNGRPELGDLRESGSIEQDADIVCLLWREAYYNDEADSRGATLIVAKHRGGPVGDVPLTWDGYKTQFMSTTFYLHSNNADHRQQNV